MPNKSNFSPEIYNRIRKELPREHRRGHRRELKKRKFSLGRELKYGN